MRTSLCVLSRVVDGHSDPARGLIASVSKLARVADIAAHGDNDTLPFDIDNRFVQVRIGHDFALLAAAVNLARLAKLHTTAAPA